MTASLPFRKKEQNDKPFLENKLLSLAATLALTFTLTAAAQTSATTSPGASSQESLPPAPQGQSTSSPANQAAGQAETQGGAQGQPNQGSANQGPVNPASTTQGSTNDDNPLGLTDDQKARLRPIVVDENQQMEAVRNDAALPQDQKVAKLNQIRDAASPKIKAILTVEQLQKLGDMQRARQQQQNQSASPPESQKPKQ